MTKSKTKLLIGAGILLLLIDLFLVKIRVAQIEPNIFMSSGITLPRYKIIGANLLIAIILYFIKKRYSVLFLINAIVCPILFTFFWNSWLENHPFDYSEFSFSNENRNFVVHIEKNPDGVDIRELKQNTKDSITIIYYGEYEKKGDSLKLSLRFLNNGQYEIERDSLIMRDRIMFIFENKLIGFPENHNEIKLTKTE